ncbi:beta-1,6-N-acetylglucosaminyltransferase [Olleya namhaensis]|uniref:Peptide O-xylosyltransferase n=1 Tax=Olleya namhaensis TaxID=1144750 RepID=A0A1I3NJ69_9FLAO|nr:beta-1,6-N-acetylglucosaminyltransferase [Olleya namhaensis]SFJ09207.1 Core-2/I-Branching enzyme [Olleya namhaensis]
MNKIYIITVHKNPKQLKRLIEKLDDDKSQFYIHVDLKVNINLFLDEIQNSSVCFIEERVNCIWGDFSQVLATINLLKSATLKNDCNSRIFFLSGQDYPIKSLKDIDAYLQNNKGFEFISFDQVLFDKSNKLYINRVLNYALKRADAPKGFVYLEPILASGIKNFKLFIRYSLKGSIKFNDWSLFFRFKRGSIFKKHFKGSNWWSLNYETALKILKYVDLNKVALYRYYQYTSSSDEQFFHTILKELMLLDTSIKVKPALHFIDWEREGVELPVTFLKEDYHLLLQQPANILFARKFDNKVDEEILNLIDESIL